MTDTIITHHHTAEQPPLKELPFVLRTIPRWLLLMVIRFYQLVISPLLPADTCRFYPTCSRYSFEVVYKFGVTKGGWMALKRLVRCNPFNPGGFDPVP